MRVERNPRGRAREGLEVISKIPQGEVCNYLGIMDTLGGPGIFRPAASRRAWLKRLRIYCPRPLVPFSKPVDMQSSPFRR